jgi:hypothetical protein
MMFFNTSALVPGGMQSRAEGRAEATGAFRSLGAQLIAFSANEILAAGAVRLFRIDVAKAGAHLVKLALAIEGRDSANAPRRDDILTALRLPTTHSS